MPVTRDSLQKMLDDADERKKQVIIGRALVAIFTRQTEMEKNVNGTHVTNNVGFSSADARSGSLTAKYFMKHGKLTEWQVNKWLSPIKTNYSRICKYARQLNEIAEEKALKNSSQWTRLQQLEYDLGMVIDSDDPAIIDPIVAEINKLKASQ